ncbi:MAG: XRE family transcriptional regulator [Neisseriales bacterium]|nr:MAG: XRE family transcriptional regulator [Neisseriales bacterium]
MFYLNLPHKFFISHLNSGTYALFLLCNNFTQEEIAAMFQVTRGTITRMIVDQIAPKLGVIVANASNVIIKAKQIGFQYQLPFNLFGDTIVIINDHENME